MPEAHDSALADRLRAPRIFRHEWLDHFEIPFLGMFHVQDGMDGEVVPSLRRDTQPPQPAIHVAGSSRSRHLDYTQCADRMVGILPMVRERDHRIAESE